MNTLELHVFGITITWDGKNRRSAAIESAMKEADTPENSAFNTGVDAIESLILAHFCAGIDVTSSAYLEGIETAFEALSNHADQTESGDTLPGIDGCYYRWLMPTETEEDGLRYLKIEGDEVDLSDLMFESADQACEQIKDDNWGWGPVEAEGFALVKVTQRLVNNPFARA